MDENVVRNEELKDYEERLEVKEQELNEVNLKIEKIDLTNKALATLTVSTSKNLKLEPVIERVNKELEFLKDELLYLEAKLPQDSWSVLVELLRIVQDFYTDFEGQKVDIETEISYLKEQINEVKKLLNIENTRKR